MDRRGQSAILDAFLFLAIALIASAAALTAAYSVTVGEDAERRYQGQVYTEDVRSALLRTTLADLSYTDGGGTRIVLGPVSVERFLLDEGALLLGGLRPGDFADANARVGAVLDALVLPAYDGAVEVGFPSGFREGVWIPGPQLSADRFTATWTYETPSGPVEIAVHLWHR